MTRRSVHGDEPAPATLEDAGGKTGGAGGESVAERGGLYARTWDDDEPEPRPPHPEPLEYARPAEPDEIGRTLSGLLSRLGDGWTALRVMRSVGYVPLTVAPWFREEAGACLFALFAHADTRVRAYGLWFPTTKRNRAGQFGHGFESGQVWRVCTDPHCPLREHAPVHPVDVPVSLDAAELGAVLGAPPTHMTDDRRTWRPAP